MLRKYLLLFALSIVIYFIHAVVTKQGLYGDGNGYYVYTQSIYFDQILNSPKVYDYLSNFNGSKYIFSRIFWSQDINPYTIGTGLVWLPSIVFIDTMNSLFHLAGDRFDLIYELGPGITGIVLMIFALIFLEKYLLNFYNNVVVFWTILTIFFATSVFYYSAFEPALSHQPSFFIICFLLFWTFKFKQTRSNYLILGIIMGLMGIIRMADVILIIPFIIYLKPKLKYFIFIFIGFVLAIIPQLFNQWVQYGNIFTNLYFNGANGSWSLNFIHFIEFLTSPKRGLFLWTPILLLALFGLFKSHSKLFYSAVIFHWLLSASWSAYLSAGFGQRLAFSTIPFLAYGISYLFNKLNKNIVIILFICFSFWNLLLIKNVYLHKDLFIQSENFKINQFTKHMFRLN